MGPNPGSRRPTEVRTNCCSLTEAVCPRTRHRVHAVKSISKISIAYLFIFALPYEYENVCACSQVCGCTTGVYAPHVSVHVEARDWHVFLRGSPPYISRQGLPLEARGCQFG